MSPTVLRIGRYRFHFYANERDEPPHIHVQSADGEAKFWFEPNVSLASSKGYAGHELRAIEALVSEHREELLHAWQAFHGR